MAFHNWKSTGKYFKYCNYNIFYQDSGEGEVIVCLHGFPTSSWDWYHIYPYLIKRFRAIAPDLIGFGYSDKPQGYKYTIHAQATLIENLLRQLNIKNIHILSHNYGDTVAQELLARYEDRQKSNIDGIEIKSVCFLNGGIFPEAHRTQLLQKLLLSPFGVLIKNFISEEKFYIIFNNLFGENSQPSKTEIKHFWSLINFNSGKNILHKTIRYISERIKYRDRWLGSIQNTKVPLKLINGLVDPVSGVHMVACYRELIPNPDIVELENIGHYPHFEAPVEVARCVLNFVDSIQ